MYLQKQTFERFIMDSFEMGSKTEDEVKVSFYRCLTVQKMKNVH